MQKIPTLFLRDPEDMRRVLAKVHPDCAWVVAGEGVPTRKWDGTCVMLDDAGWWARREVKPGKPQPPNYRPVTTDEVTGKTMGWEPIEQSAFAKFHAEALYIEELGFGRTFPLGTYELVGPKINGNPENGKCHALIEHATAEAFDDVPAVDLLDLRTWLLAREYEGIVWHHPDGRMAKLKRRDFI